MIEPLFHSTPKRSPGRPPGARSKVFASARALGLHALLGVDLRAAFERYMAWSETNSDLRFVQHRRDELLKEIIAAGLRLDEQRGPHAKLTRELDALRAYKPDNRKTELPSLDEWMRAENMDPDAWSQAEALTEYRAAHGIDNLDEADADDAQHRGPDPVRARIDALNLLQTLLATQPTASDRLDTWFAKTVVTQLGITGVLTLADLVGLINVYGHRWHDQVVGFGRLRAERVVAWLRLQQEALQLEIRDSVDEPKQARALRLGVDAGRLSIAPRFGLVPLEHLVLPATLNGLDGVFRSHMPNALEASDDLQAITRWLSRYERSATERSYRKEVERFVLWCTTVQGKALSSASSLDCQAYRAFLANVPQHWLQPVPVGRTDPEWRPFRCQLVPASQKLALVIIQTMFEGLVDAGYLVANPMQSVMKGFKLPKTRQDTKRSFTQAEWAHVLQCLAALSNGAEQRRLRCILELLVSSGIRLDELAKATRADLRLESLPNLPDTWVLSVTGKRDKQRDVPLASDVVELLDAHAFDFAELDRAVEDQKCLPLIRALAPSVEQWRRDESDGTVNKFAVTGQGGAALSAAGIYAVVKRFMVTASRTAKAAGLDAQRFEKASTHWMRHTFVRQALVDGAPIEVVSELAGHASIATTSIYSSQELARKIEVVGGLKRRRAKISEASRA